MEQGVCRPCHRLFLYPPPRCPECAGSIEPARIPPGPVPAADVRLPTPGESDPAPLSRPIEWQIVYECRQEFEAITLQVELERHGIFSWVRSLEVGGYPGIVFNETVWGWLLVDRDDLALARELISEFFDEIQSRTTGQDTVDP